MAWTPGDVSGSQTLTQFDHLYESHINELRNAADTTSALLTLKAALASPAFTGVPTGPTASANNNSTQLATTAYADNSASTHAKRTARFVIAPYGDTRPADYTCANNTNNEVEINTAITAANVLANGSAVDLLDGDFYIGAAIVPKNYVWLRGQGMFATRIHATSSLNSGMIDNKGVTSPATPYISGILSDFELDGSGMNPARELKGLNSADLNNCKIMRVYCHDTTATGLGADDFYGSTLTECIVVNCGYMNKRTVTAASWAASVFSYTTSSAHGYSVGDTIVITGMLPLRYNGKYRVSSIPDTTHFTIDGSNNSGNLVIGIDPGIATAFGVTSDSLIGHNGVGIASGDNYSEAMIISNNICIGNQNNNFLIEADNSVTGDITNYNFANNVSIRAGVNGYLNTGSVNVQFNNCYDYGSPSGIQVGTVGQNRTITAASWLAGVISLTVSAAHGYSVGTTITITGMTPSAYNGVYTVASIPTTVDFTVTLASDPGVATVLGQSSKVAHSTNNTTISSCTLDFNILYGIRFLSLADAYEITNTTVKNSFNYGMFLGGSRANIVGGSVHDSGRDGIIMQVGSGSYNPINRINIIGTQVYNNGKYVANSDGIDITPVSTAGITDLTISNVHAYDNQSTKTQRYGIIARSGGTINNLSINGGNLSGNLTGPLLLQNTGNNIAVQNVIGVNPSAKAELGNITGTNTFDASLANYFTATLTGNITAVMPASAVIGTIMTWVLTQDATGSRTLTLPVNAKTSASGVGLVISTAANAVDTIVWIYDGTNWRETSRDLATTKFTSREGISSVSPAASNIVALTVTQQDTTNTPDGYMQTNSTTGTAMRLTQSGVLASNNYALFVDSSAAQVNAALARIRQQNASSTMPGLQIDNSGSGSSLLIDTTSLSVKGGKVGMGIVTPATSAALDITSTTGALLVPRMTTTQKNALTAVNGMLIYDSTLNKFQGYENGAWTSLI